ncbi:MAG: hypothetical protein ACRDQA_02500 [Nocardioidaceae bacterium]
MADTVKKNPWDAAIDSGIGWTDQIVTRWNDEPVFATHNFEVVGPEFVRVTFTDGSSFYLGWDARKTIEQANRDSDGLLYESGEFAAADVAEGSKAYAAFAPMLKALNENASLKERDTDL